MSSKSICRWCGKEYTRTCNSQQYCSEHCKTEGYREKGRQRIIKYRNTHKDLLGEKQRYGLGSWGARLGPHPHADFEKEQASINTALRTLKLK